MKIQKFQFAKTNLIFINQQIGDRWRRGGINAKKKQKIIYLHIQKRKGKIHSKRRPLKIISKARSPYKVMFRGKRVYCAVYMVFILHCWSFQVAHVWCKQGLFLKKNRIWWLFRCYQMPSTNRNAWFTPCVRIGKWATLYNKNHGSLRVCNKCNLYSISMDNS